MLFCLSVVQAFSR